MTTFDVFIPPPGVRPDEVIQIVRGDGPYGPYTFSADRPPCEVSSWADWVNACEVAMVEAIEFLLKAKVVMGLGATGSEEQPRLDLPLDRIRALAQRPAPRTETVYMSHVFKHPILAARVTSVARYSRTGGGETNTSAKLYSLATMQSTRTTLV